jgi:signal transduction histidine kinase
VIRVSLERDEAVWRLSVSDDGIGLPKGLRQQGSGLGLRLVEAFARQAGGSISTRSEGGATVTISLPEMT